MLFETIKPQLLTLHHEAFNDAQYLFELKYDGFRILRHKEGERIEAYTRQGLYVDGEGVDLKRLSEERDWEGIVAKRKNAVYQQNVRSSDWLKVKNWREIHVVILGYRTDPEFGMIVGLNFPTVRNKPVASVQYGFSRDEKLAFLNVAQGLHTVKQRGIQWIEPVMCCRIQYLERTDLHYLRMVSFKRFLFERQPQDCKWVG